MWVKVWLLSLTLTSIHQSGVLGPANYQTFIFRNEDDCQKQIEIFKEQTDDAITRYGILKTSCREAEQWLPVVSK